jgi:glutathione S-transferase
MSPTITVYGVPGSPYGRAVLSTLEEKQARCQFIAVPPGTTRSAAHLARHPFGRVPVLQHGDFCLYETQAILRYIDRALPGVTLTPAAAQAAARMDQLLNVNDWYLFQGVASVIGFQRIVGPRLLGKAPDEAAIAAAMPRAHQVIDALARQLGSQTFFVGEELTLADLMLAPQMDFLSITPEWEPLTDSHVNLQQWLARIMARPSMRATTWERVSAMAQAA